MEGPEKRPWWSVKVSGVLRLFLITFVGLWGVAIIILGGDFVWRHWTTRSEKRAALYALDCIDVARDSINADEGTYQARYGTAKGAVRTAQKVEFTPRDRGIANGLSILLMSLEVRRDLATHMPSFTGEEKKKFQTAQEMFDQGQYRESEIREEQSLREELGATASGNH